MINTKLLMTIVTDKLKYPLIIILITILGLLLVNNAKADWTCSEMATRRIDDSFSSCGIGYGKTRAIAQKSALDNAVSEFKSICDQSDDCKNRSVSVYPKRTVCTNNQGFTCERLITFVVGASKVSFIGTSMQSADTPKIRLGMNKKELLYVFGMPKLIERKVHRHLFTKSVYFKLTYKGVMCASSNCTITINSNGNVSSYKQVSPTFDGALE